MKHLKDMISEGFFANIGTTTQRDASIIGSEIYKAAQDIIKKYGKEAAESLKKTAFETASIVLSNDINEKTHNLLNRKAAYICSLIKDLKLPVGTKIISINYTDIRDVHIYGDHSIEYYTYKSQLGVLTKCHIIVRGREKSHMPHAIESMLLNVIIYTIENAQIDF